MNCRFDILILCPLCADQRYTLTFLFLHTTLTLKSSVILKRFQIINLILAVFVADHHWVSAPPLSVSMSSHQSLCTSVSLVKIRAKLQSPLWKTKHFLLFLVPQMYPDRSPECRHGSRFPIVDLHSIFKLPHPYLTPDSAIARFCYHTYTPGVFRPSKGLIHCARARETAPVASSQLCIQGSSPPWFSELASLDLLRACTWKLHVASSQLCIQGAPQFFITTCPPSLCTISQAMFFLRRRGEPQLMFIPLYMKPRH